MSKIHAEEPGTALITIEEIDAPTLFGEGDVQPMLDYIRLQCADVIDVIPDLETKKGRQALKSAAYKVARSKTLLDEAGKNYVAEMKNRIKLVDKNRRDLRDGLDALRDEIRKPVDEWEAKIAAREAEIEANIRAIIESGQFTGTSAEIRERLANTRAVVIDEDNFGDRQGDAAIQKDIAISNLERSLKEAKQAEADAEELERLRIEKENRDQEDRIRAREKAAADQAAAQARARAEKSELEAQEARERAEKAELEAAEAAERERKRIEREQEREREEAERRAADVEHRRKINSTAVTALVEWTPLNEEQARDVITVIAAGQVPHVKVEY